MTEVVVMPSRVHEADLAAEPTLIDVSDYRHLVIPIEASSGFRNLDAATQRAALDAGLFASFPEGLRDKPPSPSKGAK